jgi:Protein of unknown function (DUF3618)
MHRPGNPAPRAAAQRSARLVVGLHREEDHETEEHAKPDIERTRATLSNDVDDLAESVKPQAVARRQVDKVKDAVGSVKDCVMGSDEDDSGALGAVTDGASAAKDAVADKAYAAKDTVSERASEAAEVVRGAPTTVKRKAQGNPLAAGVIAFGLGMLISSLIPVRRSGRRSPSCRRTWSR